MTHPLEVIRHEIRVLLSELDDSPFRRFLKSMLEDIDKNVDQSLWLEKAKGTVDDELRNYWPLYVPGERIHINNLQHCLAML